jgi:tetratricopeptide (TPR) repeat protein
MKHFFLIGAFFATIALFAAEVSFDYFKARSDGSSVVIEWRSNAEKSVKQFDVERSLNGQPYRYILTQPAQGATVSYRVVDEEAVMKQGNNQDQSKFLANNYSYRLKTSLQNPYSPLFSYIRIVILDQIFLNHYDSRRNQQALEKLEKFVENFAKSRSKGICLRTLGKQAIQEDAESLANVYNILGIVYWNLSDYPKALEYYSKALHIQ